ncbi:MAG: regulatory protein RecX [Gaiellaceae bacterium]
MKRKQPQASEPIDLAAKALRHRDRSRRQIDERLARAGVEDERRADALDALERIGYVDDSRFAAQRAESLAERGYGDEAIAALLAGEGVTPETVAGAIDGLRPEAERAAAIVARLGASPQTAARLARKGFGDDAVEAAAGEFATDG